MGLWHPPIRRIRHKHWTWYVWFKWTEFLASDGAVLLLWECVVLAVLPLLVLDENISTKRARFLHMFPVCLWLHWAAITLRGKLQIKFMQVHYAMLITNSETVVHIKQPHLFSGIKQSVRHRSVVEADASATHLGVGEAVSEGQSFSGATVAAASVSAAGEKRGWFNDCWNWWKLLIT